MRPWGRDAVRHSADWELRGTLHPSAQVGAVETFMADHAVAGIGASGKVTELLRTRQLRFVLDAGLYNQGYYAVHTAVMVAHTGNVLRSPLLRTGPLLLDPGRLDRYPHYVCALQEEDFVYCPREPRTPGCRCINRTTAVHVAVNGHQSPRVTSFWEVWQRGVEDADNFNEDNGGAVRLDIRSANCVGPPPKGAVAGAVAQAMAQGAACEGRCGCAGLPLLCTVGPGQKRGTFPERRSSVDNVVLFVLFFFVKETFTSNRRQLLSNRHPLPFGSRRLCSSRGMSWSAVHRLCTARHAGPCVVWVSGTTRG